MKRIVFVTVLCLAVILVGYAPGAWAQQYPTKQVSVIVPFTAGSATDIIARTVSGKLAELWGQPVLVDNRSGSGGATGTDFVAKSPRDGYTLLIHGSGFATSDALYVKLPYDSINDFTHIALLVKQPYILVVNRSAGIKGVQELITKAKLKPGELKFGSAGIGSGTHFVAEKFRIAADINVTHVPYKGGPEANFATIAGDVTYWFPPVAAALKEIRDGKLVPLAVTSLTRTSSLPDVPTIAESGVVGFEGVTWVGMWAPANIPRDVANKLAEDVSNALASPDLRDRLIKLGSEPMGMTSTEFARFVQSEIESAKRIVKAAGIKPQ